MVRFLLLVWLAACHRPDAVGDAPRVAARDLAPAPYTADQIRDAMPVGTTLTMSVEEDGRTRYVDMRVDAADAETVTLTQIERTDVVTQTDTRTHTWEELRSHGAFPTAALQITEEVVTVPAGRFDVWTYTVTELGPDGAALEVKYAFAKRLPGPPVQIEVRAGGARVSTMALVSRAPMAPDAVAP